MEKLKLKLREKNNRISLCMYVCMYVCMWAIFIGIMYLGGQSDLGPHANIAIGKLENGQLFSGNFLFYLLVNLFSCFSGMQTWVNIALCALLALATTWRFFIIEKNLFRTSTCNGKLLSFSLLFVFIIPWYILLRTDISNWFFWGRTWYLGYFVPNVWHNSTIIFLFPFAISLFLLAIKQLEKYEAKRNVWIALLVVLNIWIKPSYFFVFVCVYPCFLLWQFGWKNKIFYKCLLPLLIGLIVLGIEYLDIYVNEPVLSDQDDSSVVFSFDKVLSLMWWKHCIKYGGVSLAFPILCAIVYWKDIRKEKVFWIIILQLVVAIGIWLLLAESGPRADHGNFYWQIIPCTWFAYCYALKHLCKSIQTSMGLFRKIDIGLLIFYGIHVLFGILYLLRIFTMQTYY